MAGAVLLLAGAVLQITRWELAPYLYTLGAVMFGYVQVMGNRYDGRNFIIKRLRRQQIFGAVALVFPLPLSWNFIRLSVFRRSWRRKNVKEPVSFFVRVYRGLSCEK